MRKINAFKNDVWTVERVQKTFENLNSFLDDVENAKNDANIFKTYFFLFFIVFHYFLDFLKILSKRWVKNWVTTLVIQEEQPGLDLLLGEVTRQAKQVRDFPSYLHLYNLESFWWMQL